ncbi:hypothetical protein V5799_024852 [Amblyomma americanum]|uniref:Uncharacterized protein n=1 Tax=Amblyomma americanum TaxID=6943 RepID=A0AAQ4EB54_AMBAM
MPQLAERSERNADASFEPDADRAAIENGNAAGMSQSNAPTLAHDSRNEDFVVMDLDSALCHQHCEDLPEPGLAERELPTTDAATQEDGDVEKFANALEDRDRRIEELERLIGMQQAEIARIEHEVVACRRECAEQISSMRQYLESKTSEVELSAPQNNKATGIKPSGSLHANQSDERIQSDGLEIASFVREKASLRGAVSVSASLLDTFDCEEDAGVQIRQEVAAYRHECVNQMLSLRKRLEASCFESRLQCVAHVTALERRLREMMSAERETMRTSLKEMTLLRDYMTSMTDVIETFVSLYEPASESTPSATHSRNVSKSDPGK